MDDFQQIELKSTPEMTTARFTCPDSEWLLSYLLSMADCTGGAGAGRRAGENAAVYPCFGRTV